MKWPANKFETNCDRALLYIIEFIPIKLLSIVIIWE